MKTIKTILILCVALCFATSCQKEVDMTRVQKTVFENADIRQINISDAWQVTVVSDNSTFVEIEYSAYLEQRIKAQMDGTKLELGFTGSTHPFINSVYRAVVHLSQLEKVKTDDAASITFVGEFEGTQLSVELSDASVCSGLNFIGNYCEIEVEDASKLLDFLFEGTSCKATLRDASQFNGGIHASDIMDITLEAASRFVNKGGETALAKIQLQEASLLNMVETCVNEMQVQLSSASEATVWVTGLIEGTLNHASTLYYKGHPQKHIDCDDGSVIMPI